MPSPSTRILTAPNFRWLIAETLVIVLGVLIALGLDDAWTAREERQLEDARDKGISIRDFVLKPTK